MHACLEETDEERGRGVGWAVWVCAVAYVYMFVEGRVGSCDYTSRRKKLLLNECSVPANP